MADRKLSNMQIILIAGLVLIVPALIAFQLTKPDITLDTINPTFVGGCNNEGTVCTYNMDNTVKVILLNEDDLSWRLSGNCIDTVLDQHKRTKAIQIRDEGFVTLEFPANPEGCRDLVIFNKVNWDRENAVIPAKVQVQCFTTPCDPVTQDFEINIFKLKNVAMNQDVSNFIEQSYGG